MKFPLVIELVGYPGAGKTTLVSLLRERKPYDNLVARETHNSSSRRCLVTKLYRHLVWSIMCARSLGWSNFFNIYRILILMMIYEPHKRQILRSSYALGAMWYACPLNQSLIIDQGLLVWLGSWASKKRDYWIDKLLPYLSSYHVVPLLCEVSYERSLERLKTRTSSTWSLQDRQLRGTLYADSLSHVLSSYTREHRQILYKISTEWSLEASYAALCQKIEEILLRYCSIKKERS